MSNSPPPTFASKWDRITYLLAEWKWPILICLFAGGVWLLWATPELPQPPGWLLAATGSSALISFPGFFIAKKVIGWFDFEDIVRVGLASPGQIDEYDTKIVPTEIWEQKKVDGPRPLSDVDGVDYLVTEYEWLEDVEQLTVRGCDRAEMKPSEAWQDATRVKQYYANYLKTLHEKAELKTRIDEKVTEAHDATIMSMINERERANLAPGVEVTDLIDDLEDLPDDGDLPSHQPGLEDEMNSPADAVDAPIGPEPAPQQPAATDGGNDVQ